MTDFLICCALASLSIALYLDILNHGIVFDDQAVIQSPMLWNRRPGSVGRYTKEARSGWRYQLRCMWRHPRRMLFLTYELNMEWFDTKYRGWHATNIVIHAVNSVLVYGILRQFSGIVPAGLGAAVFTAHPLATHAVATISGRSSTLCLTFYAAAILVSLAGYWPLSIPLGFLAYRAKEEAVTLPVVIMALLWSR